MTHTFRFEWVVVHIIIKYLNKTDITAKYRYCMNVILIQNPLKNSHHEPRLSREPFKMQNLYSTTNV